MKVRLALVLAATAAFVLAGASPALAATGRDFGEHVSMCAEMMNGFSGDCNPGMHQGFAGWMGCEH